ncbi:hypothetical protein CQ010_02145 [Arthrobacter sp. MYb211]|uniref:PDDEXK nuclease domain-containing protein n=1 Tax=Micrococcaceae TaxID=1268 RepID=UPI000CFC13EF|nr:MULTISPECIES: PDDEXK nuclease domain-containing protein [unclassified Arthrobacter]PRA02349.1 hypothetical protein CQ019_12835 [Arthrobacter sp. MYb229]PRA13468.1 hypothetical protein CQ015_04400 [Arthrobacter sp. MYb221]PRB50708.1 hypothetical protein CQ013_11990 [Arthrobacter sp. MYb216]PRC10667.1 hypothetical protein CQ010_02145 [Arthrobacter sp. MYb211]
MHESQPRDSSRLSKIGFSNAPARSSVPQWYIDLLTAVSTRIETGQARTISAVNQGLIHTYWGIGAELLARETEEGWGARVVTRLSSDLKERFPDARGYSPRNLRYMKSLAEAWPGSVMLQAPLATLPWYHHIALLEKLDNSEARLWYASRAIEEGWSRNSLVHEIATHLHERSGKAVTNFHDRLPESAATLAQESIKDPYIFDFLSLGNQRNERDLENQLIKHVEHFLLELGRGFAFVGRQMRLNIAGDEFFPDLLFYNFKLRRFVVIELKVTKFEPGHLGQLGMYMSAVDDLLAQPDDEPTIGLLLCKTKNEVVAEYALRGFKSPIGVAEWATEIKDSLPAELATGLPTIEELESELEDAHQLDQQS